MQGGGVTLEIFCSALSYDKNPINMLLAAKLVQYMHRHMSLNIQGCALAFVFLFFGEQDEFTTCVISNTK